MAKYIIVEIKRVLSSRKYMLTFLGLLIFVIGAYIYTCSKSQGEYLSYIHSASEMGILKGFSSNYAMNTLVILLPLLASIIYSDSYSTEYNNGVYKSIVSKITKRDYFLSKIIVNFILVFFTFIFLISINEILTLSTFPKEGYFYNSGRVAYELEFNKKAFLEGLRISRPYVFNGIIILVYGVIAGLISTVTLVLTYLNKQRWIVNMFSVFTGYITLMCLGHLLNISKFSFTSYIEQVTTGDLETLGLMLLIVLGVIISVYKYALKKGENL